MAIEEGIMQEQGYSDLPPVPDNDSARVKDLHHSKLLTSGKLSDLDELAHICQRVMRVDIAAISLVDDKHQWFKSSTGSPFKKTARSLSFCTWAVYYKDHLIVEDTIADSRFCSNPLVTNKPFIRFYSGVPLYSKRGHILGTLCLIDSKPRTMSVSDIELQQHFAHQAELLIEKFELEQLAMTDSLTGLFNRRYFDERAEEAIKQSRREDLPMTIIVLDIDDFKQVNDSFGHSVGDRALIELSAVMKRSLRGSDILSRVGGEEFHILLPNTPESRAQEVAHRMREAIKSTHIKIDHDTLENGASKNINESISLTCSFGIASLRAQDTHIDEVLKRADAAMYQAKRQGKDAVVLAA